MSIYKDEEKEIYTDSNNNQLLKLRSILKKPEQQEQPIDIEKYKTASPIETLLLRYLGKNLDDATLERLGKEPGAWKSIVAIDYVIEKARKEGNSKLETELLEMVKNTKLKAEDIGLYAIKSLEGTIDEKELEQKLTKCYETAKQSIELEKRKAKQGLEQKIDSIDIVVLPISKEKFYVYVDDAVVKKPETLPVNVYFMGKRDDSLLPIILEKGSKNFNKTLENPEGAYLAGTILGGGMMALLSVLFVDSLNGSFGAVLGTFIAIWGTSAVASHFISNKLTKYWPLRKKFKALKTYPPEKMNWIDCDDIKEVYEAGTSGKPVKIGYNNPVVKKAVEHMLKKRIQGLSDEMREAYATKFDISRDGNITIRDIDKKFV